MEVLSAYVRDRSSIMKMGVEKTNAVQSPTPDIRAILDVLRRRQDKYDRGFLDLRMTDLSGGDLAFAKLNDAKLGGTDLSRVNLRGAELRYADLNGADLTDADLSNAVDYEGEDLGATARLGGGADLEGANISNANLKMAALGGANLGGANLNGANLTDADLEYAHLWGADLSGADLRFARNLSQEQVDLAHGNSQTKLPSTIKVPDKWIK